MENSSGPPIAINSWSNGDLTNTPKKTRKSWFTGTPHKATPQNDAMTDEEDLPLLKLTHFTKKVMVCFDNVRTGTSRTRELLVENPCDFPQELCLEKFPHAKGFSVPAEKWELDECESMRLPFTWTPTDEGNIREVVTFKCEGAFRLQVILLGTATDPPKRGPGRRGTFSVHRKVPLKTTQPRADLKPARPTMILKQKGQQKPKMLRASIGRARKENRENQAPGARHNAVIRKSLGRPVIHDVVDPEPCIVLSTPSPSGSPAGLSPVFTALDSSLAEINGDGMPVAAEDLLLENVKRQTLSVCRGMSPLLQTKPFAVPKPAPFKLPTDEKPNDQSSYLMSGFEDRSGSPKCLSVEASTTVTKNKAPDSEMPSKRVSLRKTLFSSAAGEEADNSRGSSSSGQEFEDSLNEPNLSVFTHHNNKFTVGPTVGNPEEEPVLSVDTQSEQCLDPSLSFVNSCQSEPKVVDVEPFLLNAEAPLSVEELSEPTLPLEEPSLSTDKPIMKEDLVFIGDNSTQLDADAFKVHTSVVTSRLMGRKRLSDPKDEAPCQVKKPRPQEVKKAEVKKQPPRDRPMNRTLALRKAAASKKTGALTTGDAKVQKKVGGQYRPKGPMKGVPMAKLNLLKSNRTAIPRHPMPFAAKNMFYDERWMEKQERGFTRWLNYVLTPDDCPTDPSCKATKIDAGTLCVESSSSKANIVPAPSKEDLSLRAYTAKRKLNRLRRGACMVFQSEPIVRVLQKLEAEIEKGRLSVRMDRKLHADYGIKQKLLELFLSYNPLWLRVGLETVYGEILPIQSNTDVVGLSRFVITRLLGNPDIAAQYAHPTVPHLFGPGYEEALSQFTLKKFLVLVFFLDRAKLTRLIDHDPCLFCKDSEFKSSRDILLHFSREYLRGEGDLTRHLSFMGYNVTHQQTALDEFDFSVTKLATDLRCGVRLARVVELLIHNWSLSSQLRCPAISRLQKIHNVEVTLKAMNLEGGGVDARVIVDGHREKTLELLWRIIFKYQIGLLLNEQQLKEEITFLRKNLRLQKHLTALSRLSLTNTLMGTNLADGRRDSNEPNVYFKSGRLSLLLKWCQVVCSFYNLKVENFTVAFSDGRALCYLVHHYHPSLLPLELIRQDTTQTQYQRHDDALDSGNDDSFEGTWSSVYSPSTGKPGEHDKLLSNERENFKLLYNRVSELGGVPGVVKSAEMSNTIPDEKVVITYVSYLCARLLDLRTEARAARTIQMVYRAYRLRQLRKRRQAQEAAAKTIQKATRSFLTRRRHQHLLSTVVRLQGLRRQVLACREVHRLRQDKVELERNQAATSLQAYVRGFLARQLYQRTLKAIVIQSAVRCFIARRLYLQKRQAVIALQAAVRCHRERCNFVRMRNAAIALQLRFRANHAGHKQRREFICQRNACVTLQSAFRGYSCRRLYLEKQSSAIAIQTQFRAHLARNRYLQIQAATLEIQRYWRSVVYSRAVREEFLKLREATVTLQSFYRVLIARRHASYLRSVVKAQAIVRCFIQRRKYLHQKRACTVIQACYRGYTAKKTYQVLRSSVLVLQQHFRARQVGSWQLREYNIKRGAIITLQALRRGVLVRRQLAQQVQAAVSIQSVWRMHREQKSYLAIRAATLSVQKHTRAYLVGKATRNEFLKFRSTVVLVQSHCRAAFARRRYTQLRQSCIVIQSYIRMYFLRKRYLTLQEAAVIMQRGFRAKLSRDHQMKVYHHKRDGIITLQALFRGISVRRQIAAKHRAAVKIQTSYKAYRDRKAYNTLRQATLCLQKYTRAYLIGKNTLKEYGSKKTSAVIIQSAYRGLLARRIFMNHKQAAVKIQSAVRMYQVRNNFIKLKQAAVIFQIRYRAQKQAQAECLTYQIYRGACITVQSWVRGFLVRQEMTKLHKAATQIQKTYRAFSASTKYKKLRVAAVVVQSHWRATKLSQQVQQDFINLKEAAVVLQSAFRGRVGRHVALENRSARIIQSYYRMHVMQQLHQKKKQAAIKIQALVRMHQTHNNYTKLRQATVVFQVRYRAQKQAQAEQLKYQIYRGACITVQAWVRGFLVRQEMTKLHKAATQIQKTYRAFSASTKYKKLRVAAVVVQSHWRATKLSQQVQQDFINLKEAAVVLQSAFRGRVGRHVALENRSARIIQSYYRMHVMQQLHQKKKQAAIKIQALVRMHQTHNNYTKLRQATVVFQVRYRAQKQAQAEQLKYQIYRGACITVQAWVRGFLVRQEMTKLHKAATQIQKTYRAFSASTKYKKLRVAAVVLQSHWRATKLSQQVQQDFINLKEAAVVLQSAFRGRVGRHVALENRSARIIQSYYRMHVMQQLHQKKKQAAIKIQALIRMHQTHNNYTKLRQAAVVFQVKYRAQKQAQAELLKYQIYRGACITVQAWVRGFLVRQEITKLHKAATQIQKTYRAFSASTQYKKLRDAAVVLQSHWRATKLSQQVHQDYINLKKAAVILQSAFRGRVGRHVALENRSARIIQSYYRMHIMQQLYQNQRQAAIRIQSLVRMHQTHNKYVELQEATIIIQKRYRATKLALKSQLEYHVYRGACITVQACVKGFLVRRHIQKLHAAATRIQCNYKSHYTQVRFLKTKEAACVIQKYWRATRIATAEHLKYTSLRTAAIVLQSVYRGHVARQAAREHRSARLIQSVYRMHVAAQEYAKLKAATVLIQSQYRMYMARQQYHQVIKSAVAIQQFYRGHLVTKSTRRDFLLTRQCVVKIQATYRGHVQRQNYATLKQAAIRVQAAYKGKQQLEAYKLLKRSAVVVQQRYRAHVLGRQAMRAYSIKRGAAITIQAAFKGFTLRRRYIKMKQAVTTLQAAYRGYRQRNSFVSMKNAAIVLQTQYRAQLLMKNACRDYHAQRQAAIVIQAMYRAYTTRQCFIAMRTAATTIQAFYRGVRQRVAYQATRQATVAVQRRFRAHLLQREATEKYHFMRGAVITIQAYQRGRVSRQIAKQIRAARTIQKYFRGFTKRSEFQSLRKATVSVQAHVRGKREKQRYLQLKHAAVILQERYRAARESKAVREWYLKQQSSAIKIQSAFRGFVARGSFHKIQQAVVTLQAAFRGHCALKEYKKITWAAKTLQKHFRAVAVGRQQCREFEALRQAAIIIQAQFRGQCARRLTTRLRAAVKIQSHYKMLIQRRKYIALQNAADKVSAHFKGRQVRRDYLSLRQATQVIQMRYRALRLMHSQRMKYLTIREAVIVIQSFARGNQAREITRRIRAAVRIQSAYRGHIQERRYQTVRNSALLLQARARGMIARRELTVRRRNWQAAACIQSHYRGYVERRKIEAQRQIRQGQLEKFSSVVFHHLSAIRLQRFYRMYKMREAAREKMNSILTIQMWMRAKLQRLQFLKLRCGVVSVQRRVRQHQAYRNAAAVRVQTQARVWLARQYVKKMKAAALTIQAVWRGHHVRRSTKDKKIAAVRARCMKANSAATEEKKLCNRMTSALDYLLQYRQVSWLLDALISLDIATRLSATCCERLVEGKGVPVIFILIKNCNRSLPSMQIIKYCVEILLNLTKYSPTADAVFETPDSISTMLDLMQMYREKGTQIFSKVCMLIGTLCQDARRAKIVLSAPKCTERLSGINRLTERKFSMDAKRALAKSKGLNTSSMSCSFLNTSALNVSGMPTPRKVRRVQPDWVLGRGKMREITDPLAACHFVMHVLQLK